MNANTTYKPNENKTLQNHVLCGPGQCLFYKNKNTEIKDFFLGLCYVPAKETHISKVINANWKNFLLSWNSMRWEIVYWIQILPTISLKILLLFRFKQFATNGDNICFFLTKEEIRCFLTMKMNSLSLSRYKATQTKCVEFKRLMSVDKIYLWINFRPPIKNLHFEIRMIRDYSSFRVPISVFVNSTQ